jgi:hypothetical protein
VPEHKGGTFALGAGAVRRYLVTPAAGALESGRQEEARMYPYLASVSPYPNSALSAGELAVIAVVPVLLLALWLILVFVADREPRHRGAAGTGPLPQQPPVQEQEREQPERKAA